MRISFHSSVVLHFRSAVTRQLVFVPLAVSRAILISYFVYVALAWPLPHLRWLGPPILFLGRCLLVPIFIFGKLVHFLRSPLTFTPEYLKPQEAPVDVLRPHMVAGIITYTLLFHAPTIYRLWRRHREEAAVHGRA